MNSQMANDDGRDEIPTKTAINIAYICMVLVASTYLGLEYYVWLRLAELSLETENPTDGRDQLPADASAAEMPANAPTPQEAGNFTPGIGITNRSEASAVEKPISRDTNVTSEHSASDGISPGWFQNLLQKKLNWMNKTGMG